MTPLPIDRVIPEIRERLRTARNLVVEAPLGSGKTTRVPPALLDVVTGEVWVLEPRRLAARLAARRVAFERGERVGQSVGYQVRFEEAAGPQTRLRFMTEGVLTRRMLSNPELRGVGAVVLDEFHERHLEGDFALALLDRLQRGARPDLNLLVMSATLDVEPLLRYLGGPRLLDGRLAASDAREPRAGEDARGPLECGSLLPPSAPKLASAQAAGSLGSKLPSMKAAASCRTPRPAPGASSGCPVVRAEGRLFDLDIRHAPYSGKPLEEQVAAALEALLREGLDGDVLVFLPGAAEIRRAAQACARLAARAGLLLLPLHGDLSPEEQDRAVTPAARPKVILSTNVAESSVTIEGVRAVIDSGLARIASDSPWTGLPVLQVARVSKASATQRAGRAGRTGPGRVVRLYSAEDYAQRAAYDAPEIERRELSHTLLELKAMSHKGAGDAHAAPDPRWSAGVPVRGPDDERRQRRSPARHQHVRWFQPPPERAVAAAEELLRRLGAINEQGELTETGRRMAALPLHPRLARLVVEAERRGVAEAGCAVAAVLSSGERLEPQPARHAASSDLLLLLEREWSPGTQRAFEQIARHQGARCEVRGARARFSRTSNLAPRTSHLKNEQQLLISVLAAFPERVARRRRKPKNARGEAELALAAGGSAALAASSAVTSELLVAVDAEERSERDLPLVRLASAIEPEWLIDLFPERVVEKQTVEWRREAERVEAVSALLYDGLTIEESRSGKSDPAMARLLAEKALEAGIARFADPDEINAFLSRVAFAAEHSQIKPLTDADVRAALEALCEGLRSFSELEAAARKGGQKGKSELVRALEERLGESRRLLELVAPERLRLPGGRQVRVNYPPGQPPWIASRLQDFFGMRDTPRLAHGKAPLAIHLLAPNQRPVQITSDLAGFWERHYPQLRRELMRRYPKHRWPEKP